MINRISAKLEQHIPSSQAAYQRNRSTTEHVAQWGKSGGDAHSEPIVKNCPLFMP